METKNEAPRPVNTPPVISAGRPFEGASGRSEAGVASLIAEPPPLEATERGVLLPGGDVAASITGLEASAAGAAPGAIAPDGA
jgi:hypothetical protein